MNFFSRNEPGIYFSIDEVSIVVCGLRIDSRCIIDLQPDYTDLFTSVYAFF